MSRSVQVVILNETSVLSDDDARHIVGALRTQVNEHFASLWGLDADLVFFGAEGLGRLRDHSQTVAQLLPSAWQLVLMDNSNLAGALGFHDRTITGQPVGFVGCKTDLDYGYQMSVTISHELLEMLADPWIMNTVFMQATNNAGRLWALEVADPCEDDRWGYKIGDVLVSDFVTPAYFMPTLARGVKLDYCGHIEVPLTLLLGGYLSYFDIPNTEGWKQMNAQEVPLVKTAPAEGSRRWRRLVEAKGAAA